MKRSAEWLLVLLFMAIMKNGLFQSKCYHVILTNGIDIHFRQSNGKWIAGSLLQLKKTGIIRSN